MYWFVRIMRKYILMIRTKSWNADMQKGFVKSYLPKNQTMPNSRDIMDGYVTFRHWEINENIHSHLSCCDSTADGPAPCLKASCVLFYCYFPQYPTVYGLHVRNITFFLYYTRSTIQGLTFCLYYILYYMWMVIPQLQFKGMFGLQFAHMS